LAVTFFATSAMAADAVAVQGAAPPVCFLTPAQLGQASNMTLGSLSASHYVVVINQLSDHATAQLRPSSISLSWKAICNHAHTLAIKSSAGGLRTLSSETPGFAKRVDYTASALWGGSSGTLQTSGVAGQSSPEAVMPGAFAGTLQLQITVGADGANQLPLLAGIYFDNIVITFKPQI
jgi:hypothetical protein